MTITASFISLNKISELNAHLVEMKSTRAGFPRNRINYSCGIIKQSYRSRTSNELTRNDQQRQSKFTSRRRVHITRSHLPLISPLGGIPRSGGAHVFRLVSLCRALASEAARSDFEQKGLSHCLPRLRFPASLRWKG